MSKKLIISLSAVGMVVLVCAAYYLLKKHREPPVSEALNGDRHSIVKGKVDVDAFIRSGDVEDPSLPRLYEITLKISRGTESYQFESECDDCGSVDDVIGKLRGGITWEGKYLLVPISCGGGNAWRCNIVEVFALVNDRLMNVGEAGSDMHQEYRNGRFHDIYDKLEINDLTSHAEAPGFVIIMSEKNGAMVANLEETWKENQERYIDNQLLLDRFAKDRKAKSTAASTNLPPLLYNSVLSKYCHRPEEMKHWDSVASLLLDQDSKSKLDSLVGIVIPGELPSLSDQSE
jgi:hypothetical protein